MTTQMSLGTVPDPRHTFEVTLGLYANGEPNMTVLVGGVPVLEESPRFGAGTPTFPPRPCGSCELWECNASERYATWVFRGGPYVFWFDPNGDIYAFDAGCYEAALGAVVDESIGDLPELDAAQLVSRVDPRYDMPWYCDVYPECERLRLWPHAAIDEFELVVPPSSAVRTEDGIWFGREGVHWRAYFPELLALPAWLGGPRIDELAIQLLHDVG